MPKGGSLNQIEPSDLPTIIVRRVERLDADLRRHAADEEILDGPVAQHQLEVGLVEGALARLVDHRLARDRIELLDEVVAGLAADQDAAHGPGLPDAHRGRATLDLGRRGVGEIGAMPLARVDHEEAEAAGGVEHGAARRDGRGQSRDVVAQRFPEAARLQEITLHIDHDERGPIELDLDRTRLGVDEDPHGTSCITEIDPDRTAQALCHVSASTRVVAVCSTVAIDSPARSTR